MELNQYLVLASFVALLIGMSKGGLPLVGMMSVPVLSLVMSPVKAAVLLLPLFVISDAVGIWLYRKNYSLVNLKILVPAGIAGVMFGWFTAALISELTIKFLIGLVGVCFCLQTWFKRGSVQAPQPASLPKGIVWGGLAGFTSFIAHTGAPPVNAYLLPMRLDPVKFAATLSVYFFCMNFAKWVPYAALGLLDWRNLGTALVLMPCVPLGVWSGVRIARRIDPKLFYQMVHLGMFLAGSKLLWDAWH